MIVTVEIDSNFIVKAKYWPGESSTGTPPDVELLRVWKVYGDNYTTIELPYEEFWQINERTVMREVEKKLLEESRDTSDMGDGFNFFNPYSQQYETR